MNFVDFVLNCYSHITSHVSQVFGSSTHYTSYSLLNIVHVIVCVFGLTNQVCKYFEFFCKTDLMLENLWRMYEILTLGKLGLKLLFLKNITSHTHAFCSSISMLWGVSKMCLWFFQNCVFPKKFCVPLCFDWSNLFFWSIEIAFKIFRESFSVSINRNCCFGQSNFENKVFKNSDLTCSNHFFKNFSKLFLSLSDSARLHNKFCRFPSNFLQGFSLHKPVCPCYPFFCVVFHVFMHYFMFFG